MLLERRSRGYGACKGVVLPGDVAGVCLFAVEGVRRGKTLSAEVRWSRRSGTASDESSSWRARRVVLVRPPRVVRLREEDEWYLCISCVRTGVYSS